MRSTRKDKIVRVRKGVEPTGENGKLWKLRREMLAMFEKGKLIRSAVPPNPMAGDNWSGKTGKAGKAESTEGKVQETH